jgi:hypothetical protein
VFATNAARRRTAPTASSGRSHASAPPFVFLRACHHLSGDPCKKSSGPRSHPQNT